MSVYRGREPVVALGAMLAGEREQTVAVSPWQTKREFVRDIGGIKVYSDPDADCMRLEYPDTQKGREQMATLMTTVTIQSVRDFNPVISDTEALEFAVAGMYTTKLGFEAAKLSTPRWLLSKLKEAEKVLAQRKNDERAAQLARLQAQAESLRSREEKLDTVLAEIAKLQTEIETPA
jgi:hypothetical protein